MKIFVHFPSSTLFLGEKCNPASKENLMGWHDTNSCFECGFNVCVFICTTMGKNQDLLNIFVFFTIKTYLLLFKPILPSKQM